MTITHYRYFIGAVFITALAVIAFAFNYTAHANPSYFIRQNNGITSTATTSISYMTPGTATTTYYFDAGAGASQAADNAVFTTQLTGSTTATIENISFEYAMPNNGQDCIATPAACDWYSDTLFGISNASTTQTVSLNSLNAYRLTFASTTVGGAGGSGNGRITRVFNVPLPTRYARAVVSLVPGTANGAVWGEFIAKRQSSN